MVRKPKLKQFSTSQVCSWAAREEGWRTAEARLRPDGIRREFYYLRTEDLDVVDSEPGMVGLSWLPTYKAFNHVVIYLTFGSMVPS